MKKHRWVYWGFLLASAPVFAEPLRLASVLDSVDQHFPALLAALQEREEAKAQVLVAEGGFDPSLKASALIEPVGGYPKQTVSIQAEQFIENSPLSVFAGYKYGSGEIPEYDGELETNSLGEVRLGMRMPLLRDRTIDRRRAALQQARLGVNLAEASIQQQRIEARRLAGLRYWDWVAAGQRLSILREWLKLATARDQGLRVRVKSGDLPDIDRVENERTIFQRQAAVVNAERELAQAAVELSLYWRDAQGQMRNIETQDLPQTMPIAQIPANIEQSEVAALQRRPELARLLTQVERSAVDVALAENQQQVALDFSVFAKQNLGEGDSKRAKGALGAQIAVDIPLFNRVQNGRAQTAQANITRLEAQTQLMKDRVRAEVANVRVAMRAQQQRILLVRQETLTATQVANGELQRFELGEGNLLLVNLREQAQAEAAVREIDALAEFQRTLVLFAAVTAADIE